jgi:O-antigen ligase
MVPPPPLRQWPELSARRIATAALLLLPLALLHARAGAEIGIGIIDALFLMRASARRAFGWLGTPFAAAAVAWWLWQIAASTLAGAGIGLALASIRLPLFAIAVQAWLLTTPASRVRLQAVLTLAACWIGIECWQQYVFGHNLFGQARWMDGALTGPFNRPRAGPALILLLFPVMIPLVAHRLAAPSMLSRIGGAALAVVCVCTQLLIGQRMPSALLLLGLCLTALMLPRLRLSICTAAVAASLLLGSLPIISPPTYDKLVTHTEDQLRHFATSPYGEIWVRAAVIAERHPLLGVGVNGFRRACGNAANIAALPLFGITAVDERQATEACNIHPHNYYLEQAVDGGAPLLVFYTLMVISALIALAAGLRENANPMRIGILVGAIIAFFPIASTSAFTSMPNSGWIFLLLGLGFAAGSSVTPGPTKVHQLIRGLD